MADKINWDAFTHPHMRFAETTVASGAVGYIDQHQLKVSRDTVIDYIQISEEAYHLDKGAASGTLLEGIFMNWSLVDRPDFVGQGRCSVVEMHNYSDADRSYNPLAASMTNWGGLRWTHTKPWIYNPTDSLSLDITIPVAVNPILKDVYVTAVFDGVGLRSGLRRVFDIREVQIPQGSAVNPISFTATNNATVSNLGDEPFKMLGMSLVLPRMLSTGVATNWLNQDSRYLNHLRVRINPSLGESWSDVPVPFIFYGINQNLPVRTIIHKPVGGPLLLKAGQSLTFEFENRSGVNTNIQVCLTGRIAAGIGSVA